MGSWGQGVRVTIAVGHRAYGFRTPDVQGRTVREVCVDVVGKVFHTPWRFLQHILLDFPAGLDQ